MDWIILGIQPTKDKKIITAAYRQKLLSANPEDKPEEFKQLRNAYENAMKYADQEETVPAREMTALEQWINQVKDVYADFPARINPESWKKLLADDVCVGLDTRPGAESALLHFLMDNYYIPQSVWQVLDGVFSFSLRCKELYEEYPRDFIDYAVMNGLRLKEGLPYDLFYPGINAKECDEYRRLFFQANRTAPDGMGDVLEKMAALSERHPYGDALICRLQIENGQAEQAREDYRKLAEMHPQDATLTLGWASQCMNCGDWTEGERLTRRILEGEPENWQAKRMLADCLAGQGNYEDAKTLIFELMHAAGGDQKMLYQLNQVIQELNKAIIESREARRREAPEDTDNVIKLAWCYLQNEREQDALAISRHLDPDYKDQYEYHHLYAKSCYAVQDYENAQWHLQKVIAILRELQPDGTEETEKRIRRLPDMLQMEGSCLALLGDNSEAIAKYKEALRLAPEDAELHTQMASLLHSLKDYDGAVQILEKVIQLMPNSYHGYQLMAYNLYELRRDRDAFEAVNHALELDRRDLGVYVLKMRILLRNGVWDGVHEILEFLRQNGITDELAVKWCEAQLTEFENKDNAGALEQYRAIAARIENGEYLPWAAEVYYRITVLLGNQRDIRKEEDREEMLAILEKGLAQDKDDFDCLDYKAWILKRGNKFQEALEIYLRLEKYHRRNMNIEQELAELYYRNLSKNAEKALYYYEKLLQNNEAADFYFYAGTCCRYLGDYTGAEKHFLREQELAPDDIDGYNGLAYVYEAMGKLEDALTQVNKAIVLVQDREREFAWLYAHKVQVLRRMGRPWEAIETVNQAMAKYDSYKDGYKLRFEICCQFGMWVDARKMLDDWQQNQEACSDMVMAEINLHWYQGNMLKATLAAGKGKRKMDAHDEEVFRLQLADLECNLHKQIEILGKRLKNQEENGGDTTHTLMNLAQVQWRADGSRVYAVKNAQQALTQLDQILQNKLANEVLYRGRRAVVLALLGREADAREELERVRRMPLCQSCEYGRCKDADIYEAAIEEILGNERRALELYRSGKENWPDELDFTAGENRLRRKVKKS